MRIVALVALVLVVVLALGACPHRSPPPIPGHVGGLGAPHEVMATLERAPCFGFCPAYKVTVYRDGFVEYEGFANVKLEGKATGQLTGEQIAELERLFLDNDYQSFAAEYTDNNVGKLPPADTSYRTKSVRHVAGEDPAPAALYAIEEGFDRIVGSEQWAGTTAEREELLRPGP